MEQNISIPETLHYTPQDEWAERTDNQITVGITDYAQDQLGDVVYVELPEVGALVNAGKPFGVIESVKAVSDLTAPVSGTIIDFNAELLEQPELINQACYSGGWMIKIEMTDSKEWDELLDANSYRQSLEDRG